MKYAGLTARVFPKLLCHRSIDHGKKRYPAVSKRGAARRPEKGGNRYAFCNRNVKGKIEQLGDKLKILTPGEVSLIDYVKNTDMADAQVLDDAAQFLEITESKAFQYYIDDVDEKQMEHDSEYEDETAASAAYKIADYADVLVYLKYLERGTLITKTGVVSTNILAAFAEAMAAMLQANVPASEKKRFEMSPDVYAKLMQGRVLRETGNTDVLNTGYVGSQFGFDLFVSNNIVTTGTAVGSTSHCIAGQSARSSTPSRSTTLRSSGIRSGSATSTGAIPFRLQGRRAEGTHLHRHHNGRRDLIGGKYG